MRFFKPLSALDPDSGGKARSLGSLAAAGYPTPSGLVITDALFRHLLPDADALPGHINTQALEALDATAARLLRAPWPAGFLLELQQRLVGLGAPSFSVRSSFLGEDSAHGLGAGVYRSLVNVAPDAVPDAVRQVLASAISPGAVAYALSVGRRPAATPVAVLIHGFVAAATSGVAALDPNLPGATVILQATGAQPTGGAVRRLTETLRHLAADRGPTEIEWAADGDSVTFLQSRPYHAPRATRPWPGFQDLPADEDSGAWKWDAAHNPLPLSMSQRGLVSLVNQVCRVGYQQRVLGGYLFWAPGGARPTRLVPPTRALETFTSLRADIDARLAALPEVPTLERTLELFLAMYQPLLGVVQPAARRGRSLLADFLRVNLPTAMDLLPTLLSAIPSLATQRLRLAAAIANARDPDKHAAAVARYTAAFGDEAAAWDVVAPTFREQPRLPPSLAHAPPAPGADAPDGDNQARDKQPDDNQADDRAAWQTAATEILGQLPRMARRAWKDLLATARDCAAVCEDDDALYARAMAPVRRALLHEGARWVAAGALDAAAEVFALPLPVVRDLARRGAAPGDLRALARAGTTAFEAALRAPPPPPSGAPADAHAAAPLRGTGTTGRALGQVFLHADLGRDRRVPAGAIVVATTLLPTELPLMAAAAFVTETGGALDHVAAQARERDLPAVVGVSGATSRLADGQWVLVDADLGLVVPLSGH